MINRKTNFKPIDLALPSSSPSSVGNAKKALNEIIFQNLKAKILRGEIYDNQILKIEKLCEYYNVSRTPVRDALRNLEQDNLVEKLDYGGYRIKEVTIDEIEEIFGIRSLLESYAAVLATKHGNQKAIEKMERILSKSHNALVNENFNEFVKLNTSFHECLYNASESMYLIRIIQSLWDYYYRYRKWILRRKANLAKAFQDHSNMIEAMKCKNESKVELLVREHVMTALEILKDEIRKGGMPVEEDLSSKIGF